MDACQAIRFLCNNLSKQVINGPHTHTRIGQLFFTIVLPFTFRWESKTGKEWLIMLYIISHLRTSFPCKLTSAYDIGLFTLQERSYRSESKFHQGVRWASDKFQLTTESPSQFTHDTRGAYMWEYTCYITHLLDKIIFIVKLRLK